MTIRSESFPREPARCPPRARGRGARAATPRDERAGASPRLGLFCTVLLVALFATAVSVVAAPEQGKGVRSCQGPT